MKANKANSLRLNLVDTKRTLLSLLSCEQTLGTAVPVNCSGDQELMDKRGNSILRNGKLGEWTIRATCESIGSSGNGLSIRASQPIAGSSPRSYVKDPLTGLPFDEQHPVSMLFSPAVRPCAGSFSNDVADTSIPIGGIIMWSGSIESIPSGWLLCNGMDGTPDLRHRFIVGSGPSYAVGAIGGTADAVVVTHSHAPGIPPTTGGGFSILKIQWTLHWLFCPHPVGVDKHKCSW